MKDQNTVAAVVLTYNRLHLLKECVAAIRSQTKPVDGVIVIDNGSSQDTKEWLAAQQDVQTFSLTANIGPAAGMKRGLQEAYEKGYDWIWIMDDDGLPHEEALKRLMEARPGIAAAKNSIVLDKANHQSLVFKLHHFKTLGDIKTEYVEGEIMPWNGTLFHREIIEKLGYPKAGLFLWGEETEYYYRVKKSGLFPVFSVRESWHYHPITTGLFYKGAWNVRTNDRAYYFIRNKYTVYLAKYKDARLAAFLQYSVFCGGMLYYILRRQQNDKLKKIKLLVIAAKDGLRCDYAKSVQAVHALLQAL